MPKDDQDARDSKAEELREEISKLKKQDNAGADAEPSHPNDAPKSPRDLIHEKMRELDKEEH